MGIIVDTSALVTAERRKHTVSDLFAQLRKVYGDAEAGLSVVTLVAFRHGIERANLEIHRERRQTFLDDLIADIKIYPVTARSLD